MIRDVYYNALNELFVAVFSLIDTSGLPYAACMYFFVDHNLNFYFLTKSKTKTAECLQNNNHIAVTVVNTTNQTTYQSTGTVEVVADSEMHMYAIKHISEIIAKHGHSAPLAKLTTNGIEVYKFTPDWLRFGNFKKSNPEEIFTQVIPEPIEA